MRLLLIITTLALANCAQPPRAAPGAESEANPPPLAPRYPSWNEVRVPIQNPAALPSSMEGQPLIGGALMVRRAVNSVELQLIAFDSRSYDLKVIDQPEDWSGGGKITACMRQAGAVAGVNGGFFTPQFTPVGLMIASGRSTGSWQSSKLLAGAVVVHHAPQLLWNAEVSEARNNARDLIQAGPRLVDSGRAVPSLERGKHTTRTFIATDGGHRWIFGLAHNVSLGELAEILVSPSLLPGFQVHRALNLDGGHSSALYFRSADGDEHADPGWSTVRNYLGIVPK